MGDGCARDWGAGASIGGKKMSLHEKGDQTRALNHNSDFSARFRVDFSKFANVCEFHFRNLSKKPFILPRIPCGFVGVSKPVSSVCFICRTTGALFIEEGHLEPSDLFFLSASSCFSTAASEIFRIVRSMSFHEVSPVGTPFTA